MKQQIRAMTTTYTRYWRVRVENVQTSEVNNSMVLIVGVSRQAKKGTGGHQSAKEVEKEIENVKSMVRDHYDFDGLLEQEGYDLHIEIVEFHKVNAPHMMVAEL